MRALRNLDPYRDEAWEQRIAQGRPFPRDLGGCFRLPSPIDGEDLRCMVSVGGHGGPPWDHVSVSRADRCPWWEEMDFIARAFFRPTEAAMQLHVAPSEHVNAHPYCLHIWRPSGLKKIPLPPSWMVGPDSAKGKAHG